jgi:ElaB/YqjD/DUF883 family membrane-anchored ribosome-binding protein
MKKKIGTVLDEELLWEAKKVAVQEKRSLSHLLEEALMAYLKRLGKGKEGKGVVQKTRGIMKLAPEYMKEIMEEEGVHEA